MSTTDPRRFDANMSDADAFQAQALQTVSNFESQQEMLVFAAMEMASEVGEVNNIIYKHVWQKHPLDHAKLVEEAGDVLWGIAVLLRALNTDLSTAMTMNMVKLARRYPNGVFTPEDSLARRDQVGPQRDQTGAPLIIPLRAEASGKWRRRRIRTHALEAWEVFTDADDPTLDYSRLNHLAPPYVPDGDGDAPGIRWFNGNWRERAYRYQEANHTLHPSRRGANPS